jgi:lysophospholipase L1-like esterase
MYRRHVILGAVAAASAMLPAAAETPSGSPTPFPSNNEDWPGAGVVRIFPWTSDDRLAFWAKRQTQQGSVVFAGDSLTADWANLAENFKGLPIANRGISGDVSRVLLFRFKEDVLDLSPRAIIVLIGANDLIAGQNASTTSANIRAMAALRQAHVPGAPLLICTVPPNTSRDTSIALDQLLILNRDLRALAAETPNVFVVDLFAATVNAEQKQDRRYFADDRLHLSSAGYAAWKSALLPVMRKAGIVRD